MATNVGRDYFEIEAELKKLCRRRLALRQVFAAALFHRCIDYQIEPIGVVVPRHKADVQAVLEVANRLGVSLLSRGGGTSLAGQAVGHFNRLGFSKYMQMFWKSTKKNLVPGAAGPVQDELNAYVRAMGLQFGPDTSTSNRATIGGMIGNNSSGAHSLTYGKTLDHVIELTVLMADGSEVVLRDLSPAEVEQKGKADTIEGRAYREVFRLASQYKNEIPGAAIRKSCRRVSGYNLDEFVKPQPFNLARMIVGSEARWRRLVEAKMRLVPKPKWTGHGCDPLQRRYRCLAVRSDRSSNPPLCHGVDRQDDS